MATAGALPASKLADFLEHLLGPSGRVSVLTVVEVPRSFLDDLREEEWHPLDGEASQLSDESLAAKYVEERGRRLAEPVLVALKARNLKAEPVFREGSDPAEMISEVAAALDVDTIILGATRPIFDESVWSSVSVKVMQKTTVPLVLIPGISRTADDVEKDERKRVIESG